MVKKLPCRQNHFAIIDGLHLRRIELQGRYSLNVGNLILRRIIMGATELILLAIVILPALIITMDDTMWDRKKHE